MRHKPFPLVILYSWLTLFALIPCILALLASFMTHDEHHLISFPVTIQHYKLLISPIFIKVFMRSLSLALICTACCLVIAYPFSYLMVRSPFKNALCLLIIIPFWTNSLVRTYALIALLKNKGFINQWLNDLGLIDKPINILYSNTAVIIGLVYNLLPFMILPIYACMEKFDFKLFDAARDLGASPRTLFLKILLPSTLSGINSGVLLVLLPAMTLFYIPSLLGGAKSLLLGNLIQHQLLILENWPQAAATSVVLTAILLLLATHQYKKERRNND